LITKNENKNQLLPHFSQALGTDFKLSTIRPIKNSLRFEVQSQRMKIKINFLSHLSQVFISFELGFGPRFQALGNKTNKKQLEV
jgi:hypothetical protein